MRVTINPSNLTVRNESVLKGLMAVLIILSHSAYCSRFTIWGGGYSLSGFNYLPVGIFFFLSGFGLFEQYKAGKELKFLRKAFTLLLPFWILCGFWYVFFSNRACSAELLLEILLGDAFVPFTWYVKTQLACYFIWFVSLHLMKKYDKPYFLVFVFLGLLIYTHYRRLAGFTSTSYITVFCFWSGMVYSYGKERMRQILNRHYLPIQMVLLAICLWLGHYVRTNDISSVVRINVFATLFAVFVVQLLMLKREHGRLPLFVGKISYELYLVQGLALCIFSKQPYADKSYIFVDGNLKILVLTLLFSFIFGWVLNRLDTCIKGTVLPMIDRVF